MSCALRTLLRIVSKNHAITTHNSQFTAFQANVVRHLYSRTTLGLDGFELQRDRVKHQLVNIADKVKEKMKANVEPHSKNMIFTEDLKNIIHLAENDEDIELVVKMMKKFNKQNKELRFGSYVFGPVVMRMLYTFNKPDLALEVFKDPEMSGFFDQLMTYQILLDLLYENKRYKDILDTYPIIKERQIEGTKYPRNIIVLVMAACYKMNTPESLEYALSVWKDLAESGHVSMRRASTFIAGLALNHGKPEVTLEILSGLKHATYTTVRNLKVAALVEIGRLEEALEVLKSIIREDEPSQYQNHTFNRDVLERVKQAMDNVDNAEICLEFNRLYDLFQKQGHISETTLDEQLCAEIQPPPVMNRRQGNQGMVYRNTYNNPQRTNNQYRNQNRAYMRPGLKDLL